MSARRVQRFGRKGSTTSGILGMSGMLGMLACNTPKQPSPDEPRLAPFTRAVDAQVHTRYAGYIALLYTNPPAQVLQREALLIRDRSAFEAFVDRIPEHKLQKRQPAPPSDDPLLERPTIDFDRHSIVVLVRGDTPWGTIEVRSLQREGDRLLVRSEHPPLPEHGPMAQPMGIGTYIALVVDRFDGPLLVDDETID
jgi:hypothetical protein